MEATNLTIIPPEGMEAYQEGNNIKFRPIKKELTYDDIAFKLFYNKESYKMDYDIMCTSPKQIRKILAIIKLMNVAKYLNGDWKPDWDNEREIKYYIELDANKNILSTSCNISFVSNVIYFKSKELAQQAIKILGEGTVRVALSTNW